MSDTTRPETDQPDEQAAGPEQPPALDADDDPDSLAGDLTDPDVDLDDLLTVEDDQDGGDEG